MAPMVAVMMDSIMPCPSPIPEIFPSQPPTKAPAIPRRMVMNQPPGSLPGMMTLARTPATRPNMIHAINPIRSECKRVIGSGRL